MRRDSPTLALTESILERFPDGQALIDQLSSESAATTWARQFHSVTCPRRGMAECRECRLAWIVNQMVGML